MVEGDKKTIRAYWQSVLRFSTLNGFVKNKFEFHYMSDLNISVHWSRFCVCAVYSGSAIQWRDFGDELENEWRVERKRFCCFQWTIIG